MDKYDYNFIIDERDVRDADTIQGLILQQIKPNTSVLECGPADGVL